MNNRQLLTALATTVLATSVWAQTSDKPLNLKLPPSDLPAASATAASTAPTTASAPGVYYGDTSGRMGNNSTAAAASTADCDDYSYNQPQVHGSVGMGVVSSNRYSGNYQTGTVNVTKAFGSCDHPSGGISISIGGGTSNFNGRGRR